MENNSRPPRRRLLRILLIGTLVAVALVVCLLAGAVVFLRTQAGSDRVLKFAQSLLQEKFATRLEYSEGRLDPFTGMHFRGLHIVRETADQKLEAKIAALDVRYALGWRRLVLNEFHLVQPKIKLVMMGPGAPAAEEKKAAGGGGMAEWLEAPPVQFEAENVAIEDLGLEVEKWKPAGKNEPGAGAREMTFKLSGLNLKTGLVAAKRTLRLRGEIPAGTVFSLAADQKQRLRVGGGFAGKWEASIRRENSEWIYEVAPSAFEASLSQVQMSDPKMSVRLRSLQFEAKLKLLAKTVELFEGTADAVKTDEISSRLVLGPMDAESSGSKISIAEQKVDLLSTLQDNVQVDLSYRAAQVAAPRQLARPVAVALTSQAVIPRDLASARLHSAVKIDGDDLLTLDGDAEKKKAGGLKAQGSWHALLKPGLLSLLKLPNEKRRTLARLLPLKGDGGFKAERDLEGNLNAEMDVHLPVLRLPSFTQPWGVDLVGRFARSTDGNLKVDARMDFLNEEFGKWRVSSQTSVQSEPLASTGRTEIAQLVRGDPAKMPLELPVAMFIEHKVDLKADANTASLVIEAPEFAVRKKATVKSTRLELTARSNDFKSAQNADIELAVREGAIKLDPALGETPLPITGLTVAANASLRDAKRFALEKFQLNLNGSTLTVNASGAGNAQTKDLQLRAEAGLNFAEGLAVAGQKFNGRISIPVTMTLYQGREANLIGGLNLHGLSWSKDRFAVSGIEGRLPFSEKLVWDGKAVRFLGLITQNPFERVDFERVRPLLQGTEQIRIARLSWEEREFGPFVAFVSMGQNMLNVHQFDLDLGPGRVYGEMFFDAYPANLQIGVLARMTSLDLGEILPKRFLARMQGGSKTISGRSGFVLNLNRGVLDGRMDLTEVGGPQLIALINTLDPSYEDEKMNKVRGLLQIGYPTALALDFKDGYMNMDVDLAVKGIPLRQSLREIPVSSLLGAMTSEIVKKTEKGPLKQ